MALMKLMAPAFRSFDFESKSKGVRGHECVRHRRRTERERSRRQRAGGRVHGSGAAVGLFGRRLEGCGSGAGARDVAARNDRCQQGILLLLRNVLCQGLPFCHC